MNLITIPTGNRLLPAGGSFQAIVDGKPTGLAGCKRTAECSRAPRCLRADERLKYRADLSPSQTTEACRAFILAGGGTP